jgi:DNA-binding transcriptional LysR family regulator
MFKKYDYVYAVYEEGSFTKAAKKLFISQPTLSVAIKSVEEEIGAPIFERDSAGVKLTEVGREYIAAAEKIISAKEDFEKALSKREVENKRT